MRAEPIKSKYVFYVFSHGQALTIARQCTNYYMQGKTIGIVYAFSDNPQQLFLHKNNLANEISEKVEFHYNGVNFICGDKQYASIELFIQDMKFYAISKPRYLAWYLNNNFHQLSNRAKIFKPALIECEKLWEQVGNTVEIKDHEYIDKMGDVQELNDYILRLSKIFGINNLVSTREFVTNSEVASLTTCYYVLHERHVDTIIGIALQPFTLKSMAFTAINKSPNIFKIPSRSDQKTQVQKIAEYLKNQGSIEENWDQKTDEEKIQLCLQGLPSDITNDPRFLFINYPDLLKQLLKEVEAELKPSKCLVM